MNGSSKTQTLLPSNVIEISPQGFKFCNSVEKYQLFLDGNNVWIYLNHSHMYIECSCSPVWGGGGVGGVGEGAWYASGVRQPLRTCIRE